MRRFVFLAAPLIRPRTLYCALSTVSRSNSRKFDSRPPPRDPVSRPRPTRAGGPLTSPSASAATRNADPPPPSNEALVSLHPSLRVLSADGENLGVLPSAEGLSRARAAGLDLVLINGAAAPPVARIASFAEMWRKKKTAEKERKKAAGDAARRSKLKEVRFTARTAPHDLAQKMARVTGFLREGHPVRVSVNYSESGAAAREEPARREMLAAVARAVAEAGVGFCDASGVDAARALQALFTPTKSARGAALWEPLFELLKKPSVRRRKREEGEDGGGEPAAAVAAAAAQPGNEPATAAAAAAAAPAAAAPAVPSKPTGAQTLYQQTRGAYTGRYAGFVPSAALGGSGGGGGGGARPPPPPAVVVVPTAKTLMRRFAQPEAGVTVAKLKKGRSNTRARGDDSDLEGGGDGLGGGDDDDGGGAREGRRRRGRG